MGISCPKCGSTNVFYRAETDEYECMSCWHKWRRPYGKPKTEEETPPPPPQPKREITYLGEERERIIRLLYEVSELSEGARMAVRQKEFGVAHGRIQKAHEKLRESSRLLGFRPKMS